MDVDEAGRDDSAGSLDNDLGLDLLMGIDADADDAPVLDGDIASTFRRAGAVDNATIRNQGVDVHKVVS